MKTKQEKRSPLKDKPLRHAGQSLDEKIEEKLFDLVSWILAPLVALIFSIGDWFMFLNPQPVNVSRPILDTIITVILTVVGGFKLYRGIQEAKRLTMASNGEKIVAEELQVLIKDGAAIFHDVIGEKFNIDHIVISKHGIFLIETKTYSKPIKKDAIISFDEKHVYVDGYQVEREPIKQAKSLSKWLQNLLLKSTGQKFSIHPVILFPGWYTEPIKKGQDVWVLNPKALPKFISNEPIRLKDTDVHLITYHLSRYIRTHEVK